MSQENRQIFRSDALRHYAASRDQAVLLHIIRPRLFSLLWVVLALLLAAAGLLFATRVPTYGTGVAVVVASGGEKTSANNELTWAVFFPVEAAPRLVPGQRVFIDWDAVRRHQIISLRSAPPDVLSPDNVRRQFDLQGAAAAAVQMPSRAGLAPFESPDQKVPTASYVGSVRPCQTEVGSQSALSWLTFTAGGAD